jgi:poly-gamma-glutamate capsule biosynthesis protein CapA/YwtB (metallophosphatase superfamily)
MSLSRRGFLFFPALASLPRRIAGNPAPPARPDIRMLLGGDIMLSRYVGRVARQKHDPAWPLHEVAELFSSADIAFANLESPFSDRGANLEKGMLFRAEPDMVAALAYAGIDIVSTANNHARDSGAYGIEFTLRWLRKHGIAAVGTARSRWLVHQGVILARKRVGFGFLGYTFDQSNGNYTDVDDRVATMNIDQMRADVSSLLERADAVIVSMHAGTEYQTSPNIHQQRFAHAAIDAGATLVVGHHPHVVQPVERYGNGVIFYSLGNLVFDQFQSEQTQRGWIADVRFSGPRIAGWGIIPVDIVNTVARARVPGAEAAKL